MEYHFKKYDSVDDYEDKKEAAFKGTYGITKLDVMRSSIMVGLSTKGFKDLKPEIAEWKFKTISTFVDLDKTPFVIKDEYIKQLETSEQITVSYFIGMVFAHLSMQKYHKVRYLEHLKNEGIEAIPYKDKKQRPDFWGIGEKEDENEKEDKNKKEDENISYLVEAKGSAIPNTRMALKAVTKAKEQLEAIREIRYTNPDGNVIYYNNPSDLKKLIIATHPDKDHTVLQHIIDPTGADGIIIEVNGNESVFKHYYNLIKWLKRERSYEICFDNSLQKIRPCFIVVELKELGISFGVLKEIFTLFEKLVENETYNLSNFDGIRKKTNKILENYKKVFIHINNEQNSVGIDGVIVTHITSV